MKKYIKQSMALLVSVTMLLECGIVPLIADEIVTVETESGAVLAEDGFTEPETAGNMTGDTGTEGGSLFETEETADASGSDLLSEDFSGETFMEPVSETESVGKLSLETESVGKSSFETESIGKPASETEASGNPSVEVSTESSLEEEKKETESKAVFTETPDVNPETDPEEMAEEVMAVEETEKETEGETGSKPASSVPESEDPAVFEETETETEEYEIILGAAGDTFVADNSLASVESDVTEAISEFVEGLSKIMADNKDLSRMGSLLERFGGVTSLASGAIAVLEMAGFIEDPTESALSEILSQIGSMETTLMDITTTLTEINNQLTRLETEQKVNHRQIMAGLDLSTWTTFKASYMDPLDKQVDEYVTMIRDGMEAWWKETNHDGILLCYTTIPDPTGKSELLEKALTYSRNTYHDGFPDYADNGEQLWKTACIGIPSEYMPVTSSHAWNVNTYKNDIRDLLADQFKKAVAAKALLLGEGSTFYAEWETMDDVTRDMTAQQYAADALDSVTYQVACKVMNGKDIFCSNLKTSFDHLCTNIVAANGVDLLINIQYNTHAFEGECRDEIKQICNSMVAAVGFYGTFALTALCQNANVPDSDKKEVKDDWVKTLKILSQKEAGSIKNQDNYCYITGQCITYQELGFHSSGTVTSREHHTYEKDTLNKNWTVEDGNGKETSFPGGILDNTSDYLLFLQYTVYESMKKDSKTTATFAQYLNKFGVNNNPDFNGILISSTPRVSDLSLADGLGMTARVLYGDYFSSGKTYSINQGNPSKIDNNGFQLHTKVTADFFNMTNGAYTSNQPIAASAAYLEDHWYWHTDEATVFTYGADLSVKTRKYKVPRYREGGGWYTYYDDTMDWRLTTHFLKNIETSTEMMPESTPLGQLERRVAVTSVKEEDVQPLANPLRADRKAQILTVSAGKLQKKTQTIKAGSALTISGAQGAVTFSLDSVRKVEGSKTKNVSGKKITVNSMSGDISLKKGLGSGIYELLVKVSAAGNEMYEPGTASEYLTIEVTKDKKATQPMEVKAKKPSVKASALKKKKQVIKADEAYTISKEEGTLTFKKESGPAALTVSEKSGNITVRKGTKKGTYKIKVAVTASGSNKYKKGTKKVTVTVKVK